MKGKDKGIYWAEVISKEGWETESGIFPKGFIAAVGDKKVYDQLIKDKVVKSTPPPADLATLKNPKKIYKSVTNK